MVFGHDFRVTRHVTYHVKEYTCSYCSNSLTTSSEGTLVKLTAKLKEINDTLQYIHRRRILRVNKRKKLCLNLS